MKKSPQQMHEAHLLAVAILAKLGGDQFLMMTGANRLEALDNGVLFAIPNHLAKHGINRVKIRKNEQRTYDARFIKVDKQKYTHVDVVTVDNIHGESLRSVFVEVTGLTLKL